MSRSRTSRDPTLRLISLLTVLSLQGHRLTLTYNLFVTELAAGKCAGSISSPLDSTQLGFYKELKAALSNRDFFSGGHVLATGLFHAYAHTSERLQMIPTALKGYDMYLYEVCRALGLQCFFRPVIEVEDRDERGTHRYVGRHLRFAASSYGEHDEGLENGIEEGCSATMLDECRVKWLTHGLGRWDEPGLAYVAVSS